MAENVPKARVLVVDDEESMRVFVARTLRRRGHDVDVESDGAGARERLEREPYDLVVSDLRMPRLDGMALLRWIREHHPETRVVVMTGHGSIPSAIEALRAGAENYITKPFDRDEIIKAAEAAILTARLKQENRMLKQLLEQGRRFEGMVGSSPAMRRLYRHVDAVADRDGVVLITGETGTGKELVARALHARGPRREGPFVPFHCASIPAQLLAAELFGAEEGAYTGAVRARSGVVSRAGGGILFLDEIGDVPLETQPALLRLLESGESTRIGGTETHRINVRIVAATHQDLPALVESGRFRGDLFFRLNVFVIDVPPLRRRREDIPDLVAWFLARHGGDDLELGLEVIDALRSFEWPGNVRQLENVIERLVATAPSGPVGIDLLPEELRSSAATPHDVAQTMKEAVATFERGYLERLLAATSGNISEAARRAGVSRPTLHAKIQQRGLDPDRYR